MKGFIENHKKLRLHLILFCSGSFIAMFIFHCKPEPGDYLHGYYPLIYKGDFAFFEENYQKAYEALKSAIGMQRPPNFEPYRELEKLANVSAILQKDEEAIGYIERLIDRGYELNTFQIDSSYSPIWDHPDWKALVAAYPEKRAAYLKQVHFDLRKEIIEMNRKDQLYRSRPDRHAYLQQQKQLDEENYSSLKRFFEMHGYPNADLIGHASVDGYEQLGVENILFHSPDSIRQAYFIPKISTFVENGQCPPMVLANLIDQYNLARNGYQIYGTIASPGGGLYRIKDPKHLEKVRQEIGLPTLQLEIQRDSVIRMRYMLK